MTDSKLDAIRPPTVVQRAPSSMSPDLGCLDDKDTLMLAREQIINENERDRRKLLEEFIKDTQQDREQRKAYADKIFWLVCLWLLAVLGLAALAGGKKFELSDTVLIAFISTVSVNIIALMAIVANYLFPKEGRKFKDYQDGK
jgi:hypothetical protein